MVLREGYAWNEKSYPSLSGVAKAITGTSWEWLCLLRVEGGEDDQVERGGKPMKPARPLRCAVYTRVSTDQGLEQEFNSPDAQREASESVHQEPGPRGLAMPAGPFSMMAASLATAWTAQPSRSSSKP
jgi:hypothetical protein